MSERVYLQPGDYVHLEICGRLGPSGKYVDFQHDVIGMTQSNTNYLGEFIGIGHVVRDGLNYDVYPDESDHLYYDPGEPYDDGGLNDHQVAPWPDDEETQRLAEVGAKAVDEFLHATASNEASPADQSIAAARGLLYAVARRLSALEGRGNAQDQLAYIRRLIAVEGRKAAR